MTGVAHKLLLHEDSSPPLHIFSVGGQRSVGHRRCAPFNSSVVGKRQIKALSSSFCVVFYLCSKQIATLVASSTSTPSFTDIQPMLW